MKNSPATSSNNLRIRAALNIILVSMFTTTVCGQSQAPQSGCTTIDANKPQLFISYERAGEGEPNHKGERRQRVWLRLHNNTNCTLLIVTASAKITKLSDNRITFDLQEGAEVIVRYDIEDKRRGKAPTPANLQDYSSGVISHLPAGRSIVFSVPLSMLKKQFDVAVPFRYESEGTGTPGEGLVVHRVYFDSEKLPRELLH